MSAFGKAMSLNLLDVQFARTVTELFARAVRSRWYDHAMTAAIALSLLAAATALSCSPQPMETVEEGLSQSGKNILVFSRTTGFRHDSIPAGNKALAEFAQERGWGITTTEDPQIFTNERLKDYMAVVFNNTTGDVLNAEQQLAFEAYIKAGGGFVGIHAAADTEYDWPWYGRLVGAYFRSHPHIQEAVIRTEEPNHPTSKFVPNPWKRTDEWYDYRENPRGKVTVLQTLDTSSYQGSQMGTDHPITWCHEFDGGRSWYTGFGHTNETFSEPLVRRMLAEAIVWVSAKKR
jgi:type 1 glutamine amidotransferase